jgi:hypothetical protein
MLLSVIGKEIILSKWTIISCLVFFLI